MVQLTEELGGLSLKRKGADEPELFAVGGDDRSVFPLSCRATKMRRLACPDGQHCRQDDPPAVSGVGVPQGHAVDLTMGDAASSPAAVEEKAMVLYGGGPSAGAESAPRLRPCGAHVRAGADWVRAMLREADSRTVRELLAGGARGQGSDLALAVVPWVPPSPAEEAEPSAAEEEGEVDGGDDDGASAMDVEEVEDQVRHWTRQQTFGCGEGYVYQWPQHCMPPPQLPVVGQTSPVMWSW